MTVHAQTISRQAYSSLTRTQRAVILLLVEEGKISIRDADEEEPIPARTGSGDGIVVPQESSAKLNARKGQ